MMPLTLAFGLGASEIGIIILVIVVFFGASKIPDLARSLGRAKGEFEKAKRDVERELAAGERTVIAQPVKEKEVV